MSTRNEPGGGFDPGMSAMTDQSRHSLHPFQKFVFLDICLFENRDQCACGNLRMVRNGHKSPVLVMEKMDMATGLPYRFKPKIGETLYDFTS
jgi:hypothetical protein